MTSAKSARLDGLSITTHVLTSMSVALRWVLALQTVTASMLKDPLSAEAVMWPVLAVWVVDQLAAENVLQGTD